MYFVASVESNLSWTRAVDSVSTLVGAAGIVELYLILCWYR